VPDVGGEDGEAAVGDPGEFVIDQGREDGREAGAGDVEGARRGVAVAYRNGRLVGGGEGVQDVGGDGHDLARVR
jgi:hypothetical protein